MDPIAILVADDEAPIRMIWERFLRRWGYEPHLAENGQVALDMARAHSFPLVITDLTMPVLTGQELVYHLKNEQPNTEIIVTTGQATIEIAVEMMKAGAYDFITKPISFNRAEYIIKKCLEKVSAQEENLRLLKMNRNLEDLNKIKEKFIAITSHELRTPVSIISNVVDMLAHEIKAPEEAHLVEMIQRSATHLNEIVGQMHEVFNLQSNRDGVSLSEFPFLSLVNEVLTELKFVILERKLTVELQVAESLVLRADRQKIKKVLRELIQNAIKFTHNAGQITVSAQITPQGHFEFRVKDTGIGIPEAEQSKIFHSFYEVGDSLYHHTSKGAFLGGGMGLGLTIVQEMVEAHLGSVAVESREGQGATFIVSLPLGLSA